VEERDAELLLRDDACDELDVQVRPWAVHLSRHKWPGGVSQLGFRYEPFVTPEIRVVRVQNCSRNGRKVARRDVALM